MSNSTQTKIKSSFLFSDGKFQVYLVINYQKKTFTLKRSGCNTGYNETSFIFKGTQNDTRGLLQLMVKAQEFALLELGKIKVSKTKAEAQWDATLTGIGYYNCKEDIHTSNSIKYFHDYIDKLFAEIAEKNVGDKVVEDACNEKTTKAMKDMTKPIN